MQKKLFKSLSIVFVILMMITLVSCSKKYKVTFMVDDTTYKVVEIKKNEIASFIDAPSKENFTFDGWYFDNSKYNFSSKITKDVTLVAKYISFCEEGNHNLVGGDDCTTDLHCSICGEVIAVAQGHDYMNATCTNPKTCIVCGATEGEALEHKWNNATFNQPKTCDVCGVTEGETLKHAEEILLDSTKIEVYVGDTVKVKYSVLPLDLPQDVKFSLRCNDGAEATLSDDGTFTALNPGNAYVTIRSTYDPTVSQILTIKIINHLVEKEKCEVFNIMTGFGGDASTEVEINYHAYNTKSFVEYTTADDSEFNNATKVTGIGYYFDEGIDKVTVSFESRNVYRVSLKNLTPNTDYIYRINQGDDTYSEIYSFTTAKNDGSDNAFLVLADTHYHAKENADGTYESHGSEISEDIIKKVQAINPNVSFILTAGDMIDTGGNAHTWDVFFEKSESLKTLPRMGVAGNHEYYITGTGQSDGKYQKAHYATPNNGPSTQLGLSGYVVYNGILILLIDNEDSSGRNELMTWIDEVLYTVDYEYSMAIMHTPIYYEDHESDNKDRDEDMMKLFEKHCVDLVLAGHYHGDRYRANYYEGQDSVDPKLGVNYASLTFSGVKSRSETNLPCAYLIETSNGTITLKRINENGDIISTRVINTKRGGEVEEASKEELVDYIKENSSYNSESKEYVIAFSSKSYGNIDRVEILETLRGDVDDYLVFPNSGYVRYAVKGIKDFYQYEFKLMVHFMDQTTEELIINFNNGPDLNVSSSKTENGKVTLTFDAADSSLDYTIRTYAIYVNGKEIAVENYLIDGSNPITSYVLSDIVVGETYEVVIVARNSKKKTIYQITYTFTAE